MVCDDAMQDSSKKEVSRDKPIKCGFMCIILDIFYVKYHAKNNDLNDNN